MLIHTLVIIGTAASALILFFVGIWIGYSIRAEESAEARRQEAASSYEAGRRTGFNEAREALQPGENAK